MIAFVAVVLAVEGFPGRLKSEWLECIALTCAMLITLPTWWIVSTKSKEANPLRAFIESVGLRGLSVDAASLRKVDLSAIHGQRVPTSSPITVMRLVAAHVRVATMFH